MKEGSFFKNILFLDKMYLPKIINIIYILAVISTVVFGIAMVFYC